MAYTKAYTHQTTTEEHPMTRTLATIVATIALLLGAPVALAAPASAADCDTLPAGCIPPPEPCEDTRAGMCVPEEPACEDTRAGMCQSEPVTCAVDQTASDYRAQAVALAGDLATEKARASRLERVADKRAATIKRLRAQLRAARG